MKKFFKRRFIYCYYNELEVPVEEPGCCDFFDSESDKCEYNKYRISNRSFGRVARRTERQEIIDQYSNEDN